MQLAFPKSSTLSLKKRSILKIFGKLFKPTDRERQKTQEERDNSGIKVSVQNEIGHILLCCISLKHWASSLSLFLFIYLIKNAINSCGPKLLNFARELQLYDVCWLWLTCLDFRWTREETSHLYPHDTLCIPFISQISYNHLVLRNSAIFHWIWFKRTQTKERVWTIISP